MDRKIKLIWDFRGPTASEIARHHQKHLQEYSVVEELTEQSTGALDYSSSHSIAFMVVSSKELELVKTRLLPHRGEYIE